MFQHARFTSLAIPLLLCSTLWVGCSTSPSLPPRPLLSPQKTTLSPEALAPSQASTLNVTVRLPARAFGVRGIDVSTAAYVKAEVTGPSINTPYLASNADANGRIPLSVNGQTALSIAGVPYGPARQITLTFYNAQQEAIPGAQVQSVTHVFSSTVTGEVSFRTTPTAQIIAHIWPQLEGTPAATTLDIKGLQNTIDTWTGASKSDPGYTYTQHPTRLNPEAIAAALIEANFQVHALVFDPEFLKGVGSIQGEIQGLAPGDTARLQLQDPASAPLEISENGPFVFNGVMTGNWQMVPGLTGPFSGQINTLQNTPYGTPEVHVIENTAAPLPTLVYQYAKPVIQNISVSTNPGRKTLEITGLNFHEKPHINTVWLDGQKVRVARERLDSARLSIHLPPQLAAGSHALQIQVGSSQSDAVSFSLATAEPPRRMVFVAPVGVYTRIFKIDADGTNRQQVSQELAGQESEPALSPDGTRIIYRTSSCHCSGAFRMVNIDGSNPVEIIPAQGQRYEYRPMWSLDGTQIVFSSNRSTPNYQQIYTMRPDGSQIQRVRQTLFSENTPTWTPTGQLLFSGQHNSQAGFIDLITVNADGSNPQLYTETTGADAPAERAPRYSPDLTQLAYTVDIQGTTNYRLYVKDLITGQVTAVNSEVKNPVVAWQDNTTLVFDRAPNQGIYRVQVDGSGLVAFPGLPVNAEQPAF